MTSVNSGIIYEANDQRSEDDISGEVFLFSNASTATTNPFSTEEIEVDSIKDEVEGEIDPKPDSKLQEQELIPEDDKETESKIGGPKTLVFDDLEESRSYINLDRHKLVNKLRESPISHFLNEIVRLKKNNIFADEGKTWNEVLSRRNNGIPMVDLEETKVEIKSFLTRRAKPFQNSRVGTLLRLRPDMSSLSKEHARLSFETNSSYKLARLKPFLMGTGIGFLLLGVGLFLMIFMPVIWNEVLFGLKEEGVVANSTQNILAGTKEKEIVSVAQALGVSPIFSIVIPKIDAKANIVQDVNPTNKPEYLEALKKGVGHARGTNLPGEGKNIFLFSHSTDSPTNYSQYNAVFFLLKKLEKGDEIIIFRDGHEHRYRVDAKQIIDANDTSWLDPKGSRERLILMTCDPPGTTWKRLMVIALPA